MEPLDATDFARFFEELYGYPPMSWQVRLAERACHGVWPEVIDLPTGAGKTACLDIAVFALACQADRKPEERTAPIRTFLVVDRRIVVDDAFQRANGIRDALRRSVADAFFHGSVLHRVAQRLAHLSGDDATPLDVWQLRGGIYRDPQWARSARQPMIVTSTVDQVGSRMLFRGYGVSESSRPIHAALVANDSLILLDEAHCSKAFAQTLRAVRRYQRPPWASDVVHTPLLAVEMTATPAVSPPADQQFSLTNDEIADRESILGRRRHQSKKAELRVATSAKGKNAVLAFATELATVAKDLTSEARKAIAIVVNRVATARLVCARLRAELPPSQVHLVIGRMRPIDRDRQADELRRTIASRVPESSRPREPLFVVATQCIEVGADLDFDAMVSEAAPLDALRQRFGRLNRTARNVDTRGLVMIQAANVKDESQLEELEKAGRTDDPVYGNALARAWNALWNAAAGDDTSRETDFGIAAMDRRLVHLREQYGSLDGMMTSSPDAPVLLPAHLDLFCQTSPVPWPDPGVSLWLHGPQRSDPEVQVCWRADLALPGGWPATGTDATETEDEVRQREKAYLQAVSLCPPVSGECMTVPLRVMLAWLSQDKSQQDSSADIPSAEGSVVEDDGSIVGWRRPLVWRGLRESRLVTHTSQIWPGDTLVLPVSAGGWKQLGFIPNADSLGPSESKLAFDDTARMDLDRVDVFETASWESRRQSVVRLFPSRIRSWPDVEPFKKLRRYATDSSMPLSRPELRTLIHDACDALAAATRPEVAPYVESLRKAVGSRFRIDRYLNDEGIVITGRRLDAAEEATTEDDGEDVLSQRLGGGRISLSSHTRDVQEQVQATCSLLPVGELSRILVAAATMHDWGKADPRFQAMLIRGDVFAALMQPRLWAKSGDSFTSRCDWEHVRTLANLPTGFRHELLSVSLAEQAINEPDQVARDALLHLIASHHGYGRPFPPACDDMEPIDVRLVWDGETIEMPAQCRLKNSPDRLDSGITQCFWSATRSLGWWAVSYLEAILRLADQAASRCPSETLLATEQQEEATV